MSALALFQQEPFETACTIEIEHSSDSLHAHVALADDIALQPGDKVLVHGDPIRVRFGERIVLTRMATVSRAGWITQAWTRLAARFDLAELYEVSFSTRRTL